MRILVTDAQIVIFAVFQHSFDTYHLHANQILQVGPFGKRPADLVVVQDPAESRSDNPLIVAHDSMERTYITCRLVKLGHSGRVPKIRL